MGPLGAPENGAKAGVGTLWGAGGGCLRAGRGGGGYHQTGQESPSGAGGGEGPWRQVGRAGQGFPLGARCGERGEWGPWRLTPLASPGPQELVAELHRRALVEYVRPLFRGRLRCGSRTRSRVAGRLREDAAQLQRLFRRLVSAAGARAPGSPTPRPGRGLRIRPSPSFQSRPRGRPPLALRVKPAFWRLLGLCAPGPGALQRVRAAVSPEELGGPSLAQRGSSAHASCYSEPSTEAEATRNGLRILALPRPGILNHRRLSACPGVRRPEGPHQPH